ncbi:MAG: glycerol-3-phosphate dehydrogenase/oxidase [Calditrichota bacterium]
MNREDMIARLSLRSEKWDFIIIGGGATGLGCAVEAASRGYRALLVEQGDFGQGTSSRSTKLVHGGVRYLQQGNLSLVMEALQERGIMRRNAPHLVHDLPFVVPIYDWWEGPFYGIGLKLYDLMAGRHGFGPSRRLNPEETLAHIPTIETEGLRGGVIYYDGQFDDSRLLVNLAQTAFEQGAVVVNYMPVKALLKENDIVHGVVVNDVEGNREYKIFGSVVINATGVFTDSIRRMDDESCPLMIRPSQGVHIVLDRSFLPGGTAIMAPHTNDGRVLFAIPWHDAAIVGTTDTPITDTPLEPSPLPEEIQFLLEHAGRYLSKDPTAQDIRSAFAGLRPLVSSHPDGKTSAISRDHLVHISRSGLLTIAGGKWTTYRRMAEETIDQAAALAGLKPTPSVTVNLDIHGCHAHPERFGALADYGSDAVELQKMLNDNPELKELLHPNLRVTKGQVIWSVKREMARTVEDVLARRTRSLILNARAARDAAHPTAQLMAKELKRGKRWITNQVEEFEALAGKYCVSIL